MDVVVKGFKPSGKVNVPCSKSEAHRVLIMAFLLKKKLTVHNISYSDDINATISALEEMGAIISRHEDSLEMKGYNDCPDKVIIDVKQSASTLRFLLPIAISLSKEVVFKGDPSLFKRPINVYEETFNNELVFELGTDCLAVRGRLTSTSYKVSANVSSQFVTGLLFLMAINRNVKQVELIGELVSKNYIDITKKVMNDFGVVTKEEKGLFTLSFNDCDISAYCLEGDYSQAANYLVLGAIKGDISVKNLYNNSLQGDKVALGLLEKMGATISFRNDECYISGKINVPYIEIDLENCIDLGPILFVCASFNEGITKFTNTKRLTIKESNRVAAMESNLSKAGVDIAVFENSVVINAIESHHGDVEATNVYSHLVSAADTLSAARPGARSETLENYIKRVEKLEELSNSFDGVSQAYAIQAGREVRVMVVPEKVDDLQAFKIARELREKIENELTYPGQIKVTVIRETRANEVAK